MDQHKIWKQIWEKPIFYPTTKFARRSFALIQPKHKNLLDLGCGLGRDSLYFAKKGLVVSAVDFSETGLSNIPNNIKNLNLVKQRIEDLKFRPESFDIIYAHLSLHYFDDRTTTKIFNKLHALLKKEGLLFVKCKSTDDHLFKKGTQIETDMFIDKGHVRHFFTKDYMKAKLERFEIIKIRKTSSTYHVYKSSFIEAVATKR